MNIILGLGNPGKKYEQTRHNVGFRIIDEIARQHNLAWRENKKFKAEIAEGPGFLLAKPLTFMNESGQSAAAILRFYNLVPKSLFGIKKDSDLSAVLTVIHDELDLPFGSHKLSVNSGTAGHNGIESIVSHLKTKNFKRLRIGIDVDGRRKMPSASFVLQRFSDPEEKELERLIPELIQNLDI